jgi:hypothetical protein
MARPWAPDGAPVGMRVSLQADLASKWVGKRRKIAMEGATTVFTGSFLANQFGGPQGHTVRLMLTPGKDYIFEYRLRFDTGYDFSRGGKIPVWQAAPPPPAASTPTAAASPPA